VGNTLNQASRVISLGGGNASALTQRVLAAGNYSILTTWISARSRRESVTVSAI
jgi:hypothetical protein